MNRLTDLIFFRNHRLCPRWMCFTFDNALRRCFQNPDRIIKPFVHEGDTVLDVGPGIGYFTIPLARAVGPRGRIIAADIQAAMLRGIAGRASREGVQDRIVLRLSSQDSIHVAEEIDFALAFWMVHEIPDLQNFMTQVFRVMKKGGLFLMAEPKFHVSQSQFVREMDAARSAGFVLKDQPPIPLSSASLFSAP